MADFDSFDYDIEKRLPEWWKGFGALEPVNKYTQELIAEILQSLLTTMGVVQPLNCWLTIPEEYTWYHHYKTLDGYLEDERNDTIVSDNAITTLFAGNKMHVKLPNTKRKCHARIQLKLLGTEIQQTYDDESSDREGRVYRNNEIIEELIIQNANQYITLNNIKSTSTIEILTETNEILIDGESNPNLISGEINKIKPTIKYANYQEPYIDKSVYNLVKINDETYYIKQITKTDNNQIHELFKIHKEDKVEIKGEENHLYIKITGKHTNNENITSYDCIFCDSTGEEEYYADTITPEIETEKNITRYKQIDVDNENKKTELILDSTKTVNFDLQIYLYKPTYTTEQNLRVISVSAFPIESIKLYGYFCHPFNNKVGYKLLFEKKYTRESRTVFDRITTQYDCERFYMQVKFYGIGIPLKKGFPQVLGESEAMYQPNPNLDRWGRIYGLSRKFYKTDITEDEEPFTFPKYYSYPIEQDYWYEERMVNEYRYDDEAINSLFIKDDDYNNIGVLECIYPYMNDIWVYTETIDPQANITHELKLNQQKENTKICSFSEDKDSVGTSWQDLQKLPNEPTYIVLNPQSEEVLDLNDFSYQTKKLKCSFDLNPFDDEVPQDITIKGIELKLETETKLQSNTIKLSDKSKFIIPYISPNYDEPILEKIDIINDDTIWMKEKGYYTIGGPTNLFQEKQITREQLFKGNNGKVDFELIFVNENNFLESTFYVKNISLNLYYEVISSDYDIEVDFDKKEIVLKEEENPSVKIDINIQNNGKIEVNNKELFIIIPPELKIVNSYCSNCGTIFNEEIESCSQCENSQLIECNSFKFNLSVNEHCKIPDITIKPKNSENGIQTGWYDILIFCEDKVITNEILIREGKNDTNQ